MTDEEYNVNIEEDFDIEQIMAELKQGCLENLAKAAETQARLHACYMRYDEIASTLSGMDMETQDPAERKAIESLFAEATEIKGEIEEQEELHDSLVIYVPEEGQSEQLETVSMTPKTSTHAKYIFNRWKRRRKENDNGSGVARNTDGSGVDGE